MAFEQAYNGKNVKSPRKDHVARHEGPGDFSGQGAPGTSWSILGITSLLTVLACLLFKQYLLRQGGIVYTSPFAFCQCLQMEMLKRKTGEELNQKY